MSFSILIVDDSATTRAVIKRTIKLAGLPVGRILEAENGKSGLALLGADPSVDLVLADLNMPEMDGFEMTRALLAGPTTAHIPVVIISAEPNAADFARTTPGVKGCLRKPFTPETIRTLIESVLGVTHA